MTPTIIPERLAERFHSRLRPQPNGCIYFGEGDPQTYASISVDGIQTKAHRFALSLVAEVPENSNVLHHCDTPRCVNPDHLFLGTLADNNRDRHAKGRSAGLFPSGDTHPARQRRGERHWCARLTDGDVVAARQRCAAGESQTSVARAFGVHPATISRIVRRVWRQEAS